ncbi:sensor histidine kinase [Nocardioides sp. B-3]|uniref:sensor histidine kinase n=1 Tax=Nocardioides sp. B-3 TaxID=2895565 RepID=UPI0021530B1C|nr:histidine kinase dimerization/phospho-acceptor domain-containing protein [Nocardioides sp. B-3]UUZ61570.1 hypothetical protein LP418_14075 [Nocardioides sp. B-3]
MVVVDIDLLPEEAEQDRREIAGCGISSLIVPARVSGGVMFGSLAVGSVASGPWPAENVADFRLISSALASRIALEQARRSLAEAVEVGAKSREAQQHFFASIGHELRTPLTAIVGYTEMLVDEAAEAGGDALAGAVVRDGGVILRACEQLMAVVEDLLSAGRAVGSTDLREAVDVGAAVADVLHWHRAAAETAGVQLSNAVSPAGRSGPTRRACVRCWPTRWATPSSTTRPGERSSSPPSRSRASPANPARG